MANLKLELKSYYDINNSSGNPNRRERLILKPRNIKISEETYKRGDISLMTSRTNTYPAYTFNFIYSKNCLTYLNPFVNLIYHYLIIKASWAGMSETHCNIM